MEGVLAQPRSPGDVAIASRLDVRKIGPFGTRDLELRVSKRADLDVVLPLVRLSYEGVGG
jgi:predicted transport protein